MVKLGKEKIMEIFRYLVVGVLTTLVSLVSYYALVFTVLDPTQALELQLANIISWILSVVFAYFTNRIFVFQSKNEKKLKEAISFVGSRVVTLVLDMLIMLVGVSLIHLNDKLVKLCSQVLVIAFNYILSKLFVFKNGDRKKIDLIYFLNKIIYVLVLCMPFLFLIKLNSFVYGYSVFLFVAMLGVLFKEKKHFIFLFLLLIFFVIEHLYFYCRGLNVVEESLFLVSVFLLPISCLYFKSRKVENYFYVLSCFLANLLLVFSNTIIKNSGVGILILMCPIILYSIWYHNNYIVKSLGICLFLLTIIFGKTFFFVLTLFWSILLLCKREGKAILNDKIFLGIIGGIVIGGFLFTFSTINFNQDELIKNIYEKFASANIEEQIFGITSIKEIDVKSVSNDVVDMFFHLGYFGFSVYVFVLLYTLFHVKMLSYKMLGFLMVFVASCFMENILVNGYVGLMIGSVFAYSPKRDKKVLLVSNMYPSKRYKHYGSFVKNTAINLENMGFVVDKVVKKKQDTFLGKFIGYSIMYLKAFYKSIFYSYDYIYVHFISQSTFCVLLGRITSKHTKLVLNVHGNDIVPDHDFEEKNVLRSKFVLPYADIVIAPSMYFKDVLINNYHVNSSKICIYPAGGIDFNVFSSLSKSDACRDLGLDENVSYYGYVGRIEKDKGYDVLLNAIWRLNEEGKFQNCKLIIIGTGDEQGNLLSLIQKYELEDKVIQREFVYQSDLVKYYNVMDLFLFPTKRKSESLGLVGLEALACRTFVIGCTLYGPREYLRNGINSFTYKEDDDLFLKIKEFQDLSKIQKEKIIEQGYLTACKYDKMKVNHNLIKIFGDGDLTRE